MKIFGRNDIKTTVAAEPVSASERNNESGTQAPALHLMQALSMLLMYAVVGGAVGFALRALLYMAGFKQWMFLHIPSFVPLGAVLKSLDGEWGAFLLMMLAFFGAICGVSLAITRMLEG
ncbi:MAG: hypothetical protein WCP20_23335 [Desulfuromonadales bacterium]